MGLVVVIEVQIDTFNCVRQAMIEETRILFSHIGQAFICNLYNLGGLPKDNYTWTKPQKLEYGRGKNAE